MSAYCIDTIEGLARQMSFTPQETRIAQLASAEALLNDIDPVKAYPLDFVTFRITGYHPKDIGNDLLPGAALQHDLGILIEQVSETLDFQTTKLAEPVLSIDDVTTKFHVTSKTVQRWRRRGLPARRFVFPDGKRRVGFLLSSVDRFFATHRDQVMRGTNFSQVDEPERDEILRRAKRLAQTCQCCSGEITRRIARKLNRSPLTILHTIRKHDQEHPGHTIFHNGAAPLSDDERAKIARAYRHGMTLFALAERLGRSRQAIYRIVMDERIARMTRRNIRFIDDPLFHQPDAAAAVHAIISAKELRPVARPEDSRIPRDLPAYLQELYRTPLLTPNRERALFLKFNFHKYQFLRSRERLDPQLARSRELDAMESHLRHAVETKNQIIRANLRLVVSVGRKHLRPGLDLMEMISDGNITLMRAIDGFDIRRGNRFSTYATLALMKGFARSVPLMRGRQRTTTREEALAEVPDSQQTIVAERVVTRDHVRQMLSNLSERERSVVETHYGITLDGSEAKPATYEQVGERLGLSKQRVRQIEQTAMAKLRASAQ